MHFDPRNFFHRKLVKRATCYLKTSKTCQSIDHIKVLSTAKVSWMFSLPLATLPPCRLASSSAHDRYICQEVESLDMQSKAQPVCAAEPMMAGFVCGLLRLPDTIRASTGPTAFLWSRNRSSKSPNWSPLAFRFLEVRICTRLYIFLYDCASFSTSNPVSRARGPVPNEPK